MLSGQCQLGLPSLDGICPYDTTKSQPQGLQHHGHTIPIRRAAVKSTRHHLPIFASQVFRFQHPSRLPPCLDRKLCALHGPVQQRSVSIWCDCYYSVGFQSIIVSTLGEFRSQSSTSSIRICDIRHDSMRRADWGVPCGTLDFLTRDNLWLHCHTKTTCQNTGGRGVITLSLVLETEPIHFRTRIPIEACLVLLVYVGESLGAKDRRIAGRKIRWEGTSTGSEKLLGRKICLT